jgi:hypothetical protein
LFEFIALQFSCSSHANNAKGGALLAEARQPKKQGAAGGWAEFRIPNS